jgi:hypothetical protein
LVSLPYPLEFQVSHHYEDVPSGIPLPVVLRVGNQEVEWTAKLDTGAQYCVFARECGEQLGLTIEAGRPQRMEGLMGQGFDTFEHEVTIEVLGYQVLSPVFFARDPGFRRSVLGRVGWLNKFRLALIDYERDLYLSPYDE